MPSLVLSGTSPSFTVSKEMMEAFWTRGYEPASCCAGEPRPARAVPDEGPG